VIIKKKHILVLPSWYPNSYNKSSGNFNKAYVNELSRENKLSVLHVEHRKEVNKIELSSNLNPTGLEVIVYVPIYKGFLAKTKNNINFFKACEKGFIHVKKEVGYVDLVHNMVVWKMGLFALKLKDKYGIPYIVTEHSTALMDKHKAYNRFQKLFIIKVLKNASMVTAVSEKLLKGINTLTRSKSKGMVVPNIININQRSAHNELLKNTFVHVSSLNEDQKNISGILNAIKLNPKANLHVIGGNNEENIKAFQKMVYEKKLGDRVTMLGNLPQGEVLNLLDKYEAMLHFSNYESFSLVCAEAMSVGLPVVFTACGGPEEFLDTESGVMVEIGDENALSIAIHDIMNKSNLFDRERIRKKFKNSFNNKNVVVAFTKLYTEIS